MTHFDRPHGISYAGHATRVTETRATGSHEPGSYEAQMAIRRVFAVMNPGRDYDETMAQLRRERERRDSHVVDVPHQVKMPCKVCGALIVRTNNNSNYCGPCSATVMQMSTTNRTPGITAMANKARKYQR